MIKQYVLIILLLINGFTIYSQIPIGIKYDMNGETFNGYFDPLTYTPDEKIEIKHNSDSYEIGYYYDEKGNKIHGLIKFQDKKIWFKDNENERKDKIKPEEVDKFVIGVDSFFTISKYYYQDYLKEKMTYVQYISDFNGLTFAKHYYFRPIVMQGQSPIVETFLVKTEDSDVWENFPDNRKFKDKALKYFDYLPILKQKLLDEEYGYDEMHSIIKTAEYYEKYQLSEPVYYDKYWQETRDVNNSMYHANIVDKQDTIWTFEYFKDSLKIYKADYSSFYPNKRSGEFIAYYPTGTIRQKILFEAGEPKEVIAYNEEGKLTKHYKYIEDANSDKDKIEFVSVFDSSGNKELDINSNAELKEYDQINGLTWISTFNNKQLIASYRMDGQNKVFHITRDYKYNIKRLSKSIDYYVSDREYDSALSVNAQGTMLLSLFVDRKGYVLEAYRLNSIHHELDSIIDSYLQSRLLPGGDFRFKLKPYKRNKEKQYFEVVIPVEFKINRFYRSSPGYYNFHYMHWHHHQMIHNSYTPSYGGF